MCIKNMKFIFTLIVLLVLSVSGFCSVDKIETKILQIKMNRIYFASGEEENIFQDCLFFIIKTDDTLFDGYIEASYPGISFSYPIKYISDTLNFDSCAAFIYPAKIDRLTPINIGILKSIPYGSPSNFPGITSVSSTTDSANDCLSRYGNIIHTHIYDSETEMLLDYEAGIIDAFISFKRVSSQRLNTQTVSSPAPFYAALIPNISKAVNSKGLLTTSLYYRFNDERLSAIFRGDKIEPYFCLYPADDTCRRLYSFNPDDGRNLLNYLDKKPKKLFFSAGNSSLEKLGLYFADILSRDRIRVKFTEDNSKADIHLRFIPLSGDNIDSSLTFILDLLKTDLSDDKNSNITITEITQYLESAGNAISQEGQKYYFNLAQRSFIEDLGIFPLLRPSLFFISGENLKGCAFDNNGRLELGNLRKVVLPQKQVGVVR